MKHCGAEETAHIQHVTPGNTYLLMNSCLSSVKIVTVPSFTYQVINGTGDKSENS